MGNTRQVVACAMAFACAACGTGDTKVDPGDLELRDLLGVSPDVAASWDSDQRASARRVLLDHLDDEPSTPAPLDVINAPTREEALARALANLDARRFADGDGALGLVAVTDNDTKLVERRAPSIATHATPQIEIQLSDRWGTLDATARAVLAELAVDAGYHSGPLTVSPEPRLAVIAAYTPGHLVVNPVLLAAFDPDLVELPRTSAPASPPPPPVGDRKTTATAAGNPYSFYGSINECAYAQRLRCESCLPNNNCTAVTSSDGNTECNALAADDGRGYFLLCINLALAITSVDECAAGSAPGCARVTDAASDLSRLDANASFLTDGTCSASLDGCLAKIYGAPPNPFPGLVDGGVSPPPSPPRDTEVSCGDSCSDNNTNCDASPNCDCSGPSCNNSLSCDSTCSNSNTQSGCGGACDSCSNDSSSGGGGGGGGGCGGDSSSGGGGGGGGCGGCSGGSSGGGTSSGGSSGCGGGGGGCSGGGCSDNSSSSGGGCSGGGGGGGGGGCQVTRRDPSPAFAVALSLTWALLPIPLAAAIRRRSRRRQRRGSDNSMSPPDNPMSPPDNSMSPSDNPMSPSDNSMSPSDSPMSPSNGSDASKEAL